MDFTNKFPDWKNKGTPPPEELQTNGFEGGDKPPAAWLNWLCNIIGNCITELQNVFTSHANNKNNPHNVTKEQIGLDRVDNTPDSEKIVSEAGFADYAGQLLDSLTIRLNNGNTEDKDKFTFDGLLFKTVNITPESIGGADYELSNVDDDVFREKVESSGSLGVPIVNGMSADGVAYTATVPNLEIKVGTVIAFVPNMTTTSKQTTLDINGTGALRIFQSISSVTSAMVSPTADNWLNEERAVLLTYFEQTNEVGHTTKVWKTVSTRTTDEDIYGTIGPEKGGTGVTDLADAWVGHAYHLTPMNCSNLDFNTLKESARYFGYTGMVNGAFEDEICVLEVIPYSEDWVLQRQTRLTDGRTYERYLAHGDSWSEWHIAYTSKDHHPLPKMHHSTYTGTGVFGVMNTNRVRIDFTPSIVFVWSRNGHGHAVFVNYSYEVSTTCSTLAVVKADDNTIIHRKLLYSWREIQSDEWNGTQLAWYNNDNTSTGGDTGEKAPERQLNRAGEEYVVVAFGF